jgi:hypothetical protein
MGKGVGRVPLSQPEANRIHGYTISDQGSLNVVTADDLGLLKPHPTHQKAWTGITYAMWTQVVEPIDQL